MGDWVTDQIESRGVINETVLRAMRKVPRHLFVPKAHRAHSYEDRPLPIGPKQTISQPFIVAYMTDEARVTKRDKVLEVGTGSGYQTAVLAELAGEVYTIEVIEKLSKAAQSTLQKLGYTNVHCRIGDGYTGWPEAEPFDLIILTAAPPRVPTALLSQLREGGRMIAPVGTNRQELVRITKTKKGFDEEKLIAVSFVPLVPHSTQ